MDFGKLEGLLGKMAEDELPGLSEKVLPTYARLLDLFNHIPGADTAEGRGALFEASPFLGEGPNELDLYLKAFNELTNRLKGGVFPFPVRVRATTHLYLMSYVLAIDKYGRAVENMEGDGGVGDGGRIIPSVIT